MEEAQEDAGRWGSGGGLARATAVGVLAWEDGGCLAGARARQHGVGPLPMAPGPGRWFDGRRGGGAILEPATAAAA